MEDLLFLGVNLEKEVRKFIVDNFHKFNTGMTKEEMNAFNYGVDFVFKAIDIVTETSELENTFVVLTDDDIPTEYTVEELVEKSWI